MDGALSDVTEKKIAKTVQTNPIVVQPDNVETERSSAKTITARLQLPSVTVQTTAGIIPTRKIAIRSVQSLK